MAMPLHTPSREPGRWTIEDLDRLPDDGNRYEIIDGALYVTPAPSMSHQRAVRLILSSLSAYVELHGIGEVFYAPTDLEVARNTIVEPDGMVLPPIHGPLPRRWSISNGVLLAVEILSPTTARSDRQAKRRLYQRERIAEYWIVDLEARLVERWRPEDERPEILVETLTWSPPSAPEPFVMRLPEYFARVWGD
jgi:Uma2 family endonuclease